MPLRDTGKGSLDRSVEALGFKRNIVTVVGGFTTAPARASELVATVPERHTDHLRSRMTTFPLSVDVPEFSVSLIWHPRMDADPAHHWLRSIVREVCAAA